ncbi:hypothetical protein BX600DRAFT_154431 [Xylariales sp. PMI_506]|nr:hypothetical protein BX600DRAFT_154431 [Xylariales sp. PMI_506]
MLSVVAIVAAFLLGQACSQSDISACSAGCVDSVFGDPSLLGCGSTDLACVCAAGTSFTDGIRDCITQACGLSGTDLTDQINDAEASGQSRCATITNTAAATSPTTTSVASPTTAVTTTAATTTTPASPQPTTLTTEQKPTSPTAASSPSSTSGSPSATTTAATSAASAVGASHSSQASQGVTTATGAASTTSSAADASSTESSSTLNLSVAAKAGIGAGAGVALILSAIIACYVCSKKRKPAGDDQARRSRIPTMLISKPLPGSGRQYAHEIHDVKFGTMPSPPIAMARYSPSAMSSRYSQKSVDYLPTRPSRDDDRFPLQSRRYEDMMQREKPRTMV